MTELALQPYSMVSENFCIDSGIWADSFICDSRGLGSAINTSVETNCLAMLIFGWAYILSVKLVELREKPLERKEWHYQYRDWRS